VNSNLFEIKYIVTPLYLKRERDGGLKFYDIEKKDKDKERV
jgi:hypothetical protein